MFQDEVAEVDLDAELVAMQEIYDELLPFDFNARFRMLRWAESALSQVPPPEVIIEDETEDQSDDPNAEALLEAEVSEAQFLARSYLLADDATLSNGAVVLKLHLARSVMQAIREFDE
jgi:hypothetical protein